jgi:hypothetical protein
MEEKADGLSLFNQGYIKQSKENRAIFIYIDKEKSRLYKAKQP